MASCLDLWYSRPDWLDFGEKRNAISSIIAGTLFFTGWWIIIDVSAVDHFYGAYHICGVFSTLSLFMINAVTDSQISDENYSMGIYSRKFTRVWLFIGFVFGFLSVIVAVWILVSHYIIPNEPIYPGIGLLLQNLFIFAGSLVFKFGRTENVDD